MPLALQQPSSHSVLVLGSEAQLLPRPALGGSGDSPRVLHRPEGDLDSVLALGFGPGPAQVTACIYGANGTWGGVSVSVFLTPWLLDT